ncbi:hypothetical protein HDU76_009896 [Blyttiomyces sp. JEL0837]|nr:hypothetical protein HDU76_009896 [Blyttiomyces sp. JEL0837]
MTIESTNTIQSAVPSPSPSTNINNTMNRTLLSSIPSHHDIYPPSPAYSSASTSSSLYPPLPKSTSFIPLNTATPSTHHYQYSKVKTIHEPIMTASAGNLVQSPPGPTGYTIFTPVVEVYQNHGNNGHFVAHQSLNNIDCDQCQYNALNSGHIHDNRSTVQMGQIIQVEEDINILDDIFSLEFGSGDVGTISTGSLTSNLQPSSSSASGTFLYVGTKTGDGASTDIDFGSSGQNSGLVDMSSILELPSNLRNINNDLQSNSTCTSPISSTTSSPNVDNANAAGVGPLISMPSPSTQNVSVSPTMTTPNKCQFCNVTFKKSHQLSKHLRTTHKLTIPTTTQSRISKVSTRKASNISITTSNSLTAIPPTSQSQSSSSSSPSPELLGLSLQLKTVGLTSGGGGNVGSSSGSSSSSTVKKTKTPTMVSCHCGATFKRRSEYNRHYKSYHPNTNLESEPQPTCSFCHKVFSRNDNLKRHEISCVAKMLG